MSPGAAGGTCKAARKPATITKIARARHAATTRQACDARGRRLDIVTCLGCPARAAAGPARVRVGDGATRLRPSSVMGSRYALETVGKVVTPERGCLPFANAVFRALTRSASSPSECCLSRLKVAGIIFLVTGRPEGAV